MTVLHMSDYADERDDRVSHRYAADRPDLAIDAMMCAVAPDPGVYQRSGRLVHLSVEMAQGLATSSPTIRDMTGANLRDRASSLFVAERESPKGWVAGRIPDEVISGALDRGRYHGVRPISGVIETPSITRGGEVMPPGYDAATGLVYVPSGTIDEMPDRPTQGDACFAVSELAEVFRDFPFASLHHAAAAVASLLTLFARPAIDGPVPLMMIEASTRGTGKSRMIDAIANIAVGRDAAKRTYSLDAEEMRKSYTSAVMAGRTMLVLDNIARVIGDATLDSLLTSCVYDDRQLGKNADVNLRHWLTIFASANNPSYAGDTARRTLPIRLESRLENPEDRQDFRHPDLLGWVRKERPRLMRAALIVLRAWYVAGCPDMGCRVWGSFERWSSVIPHAIMHAGMVDPMLAREGIESEADPARCALGVLIEGWGMMDGAGYGLTVSQVMRSLYPAKSGWDQPPPDPPYYDSMRDALMELAPPRSGERPEARAVGIVMRRARARVVGGRMVVGDGTTHGSARWRVVGV